MSATPESEIQAVVEPLAATMPEEESATLEKPKVLIVGAGIGGLMLGNFLEKGGIPYAIYERAKEVRPLGSVLSLGSTFAPLFEQIGILDDLRTIGKPNVGLQFLDEDLTPLFLMDLSMRPHYCGGDEFLLARPDLYNLLLRQIPKEKIHMNQKFLSFVQNDDGVTIQCQDNQTHRGDILVGADGAYSAVRQELYKDLKAKKQLPPADEVPLPFSCVCLVGQTEVLDSEEFPDLNLPHSKFNTILGSNQFSWVRATTKQNTVCWIVTQFLTKETAEQKDELRNSEWGPEAAEAMCNEVRHFKMPGGKDGKVLTIGDYIDRTPKHLISKVMLEEKVFETWFGGRAVLIGDACHKLNPAGGAGAATTIQDAAALANWICALQSKKASDIEYCFKEYRVERYPIVKAAYEASKIFNHVGGKDFVALLVRTIIRIMPRFLWTKFIVKGASSRPQLSFLPLVKDAGIAKPVPQPSLEKTLEIIKKRADADKAKTAFAKAASAVGSPDVAPAKIATAV